MSNVEGTNTSFVLLCWAKIANFSWNIMNIKMQCIALNLLGSTWMQLMQSNGIDLPDVIGPPSKVVEKLQFFYDDILYINIFSILIAFLCCSDFKGKINFISKKLVMNHNLYSAFFPIFLMSIILHIFREWVADCCAISSK